MSIAIPRRWFKLFYHASWWNISRCLPDQKGFGAPDVDEAPVASHDEKNGIIRRDGDDWHATDATLGNASEMQTRRLGDANEDGHSHGEGTEGKQPPQQDAVEPSSPPSWWSSFKAKELSQQKKKELDCPDGVCSSKDTRSVPKYLKAKGVNCEEYGVIVDAGSSGTRLYALYDVSTPDPVQHEVGRINRGVAKVGVDAIFEVDEGGVSFGSLLTKSEHFLNQKGCSVATTRGQNAKLLILGTAGTRLLSDKDREQLWDVLKRKSQEYIDANDLHFDIVEMTTITGEEEAYYAFLALNLLNGKIDEKYLIVNDPDVDTMLDMGGASTQLVFPIEPPEKGRVINKDTLFMQSYLRFGGNVMFQGLPLGSQELCSFQWASEKREESTSIGVSQRGSKCRDAILRHIETKVLQPDGLFKMIISSESSRINPEDLRTIRKNVPKRAYAIEGFYYLAASLAQLSMLFDQQGSKVRPDDLANSPLKIENIMAGSDLMCAAQTRKEIAGPLSQLEGFDQSVVHKLCFQSCYHSVLLGHVYQWTNADFYFIHSLGGQQVGWQLGAYLSIIHEKGHGAAHGQGDPSTVGVSHLSKGFDENGGEPAVSNRESSKKGACSEVNSSTGWGWVGVTIALVIVVLIGITFLWCVIRADRGIPDDKSNETSTRNNSKDTNTVGSPSNVTDGGGGEGAELLPLNDPNVIGVQHSGGTGKVYPHDEL